MKREESRCRETSDTVVIFKNKVMAKPLLSKSILILKSVSTIEATIAGTGSYKQWVSYAKTAIYG